MKISSDSFRHGGPIPAGCAFAAHCAAGVTTPGGNRNPQLRWSEVPAGTESLVLLCIDGDAPIDASDANRPGASLAASVPRADFFHWSLVDIPTAVGAIAEGALSDGVVARGKAGPLASLGGPGGHIVRQGLNDYSAWFAADPALAGDYHGYDGPCPPCNDERVHHYIFRLYALDIARLALEERFTCVDVLDAMYGHIIDEAQLIGTYTLNPALASVAAPGKRKNTA